MLDCIRRNLTEDGAGLITVPSLEYILKYDGYYELIRDHLAYYTFDTLRYLLERHGFQVLEEEMVNRDTLSVIVKKGPLPAEPPEPGPLPPLNTAGLQASLADIRGQMERLAGELARTGQTFAVWGAGHQGFTLAATTCLGQAARYIIDSAPFKQGRWRIRRTPYSLRRRAIRKKSPMESAAVFRRLCGFWRCAATVWKNWPAKGRNPMKPRDDRRRRTWNIRRRKMAG